jgi:hypothetical protein
MNISDYRLLKSHFGKITPARFGQAPRTKPEAPKEPPEYPTPIEIPDPTEIPPPVPGDAPIELPGPEENPTPEIEPPKEQLNTHGTFSIRIQQIRSQRSTLIKFIRQD